MGIFDKLSRLIKSNLNDLISRAEDPEKMLNQIILDMRDQLSKAKREVAGAIADERRLRQQLDEEVKQTRDWEQRAMLAVREGRDDLAKQALVRHQEHAQRASELEQTWRTQATETEKLKGSLRQLNEKIEEARRKRNLLIAKQKRAQAQKRIHETMSGMSDASAFDAFNRMAEKIEDTERKTLAAVEVDEALQIPDVEKEFIALEAGKGSMAMDDRLMALKQQMGLLPGGAPAERRQLGAGGDAKGAVQDAQVEIEEDAPAKGQADGAPGAPPKAEAELLEEFEKLEQHDSR